jgi:hypothetical protein
MTNTNNIANLIADTLAQLAIEAECAALADKACEASEADMLVWAILAE